MRPIGWTPETRDEPVTLEIPWDGSAGEEGGDRAEAATRPVPVHLRHSARARRVILRVDSARDRIELVLPTGVPREEALDFARSKTDWLARQLDAVPDRVPFRDGHLIPYRGVQHRIRHRPDAPPTARGIVWSEPGAAEESPPELHVMGSAPHVPRRVEDWLRREARAALSSRAREKAAEIDRRPARVTVRDTRSRWGSCSRDRAIAFSWRLILAPDWVLDYVVAHEVAHLRHMNHGPRFWALCASLTEHCEPARAWLRENGRDLHRYG